jgi:hypothetical protein
VRLTNVNFPERVYTIEEVQQARKLIKNGYKHSVTIEGNPDFKQKVEEILNLIKTAGYYEFLRTYIKKIVEIKGLTQLRESEVAIWASKYTIADPVDAASLFIQKTQQMKDYIDGKLYYEMAEIRAVKKRIEFLETLKEKTNNNAVKKSCEDLLKRWAETTFP